MNSFDIDKHFISEYDKFLRAFDDKHPEKTKSQLKEINKHNRLAKLRDDADAADDNDAIWSEF